KISIQPHDELCDNHIDGVLRELMYLGDHYRVVVDVVLVGQFVVKVPNDNRTHLNLIPGTVCRIGWKSTDCHALDAIQPETEEVAA
ncbi:TOBE domain-containing protein, partial [Vibrio cholerae]|uniref:TOBE domain-containing protein n=1 Tax=Vibrio cholerae TaxID=666 RepID=UPI0018F0E3E4